MGEITVNFADVQVRSTLPAGDYSAVIANVVLKQKAGSEHPYLNWDCEASGARTLKMKFGHHGANHPVLDLDTGRVMISSQNHGFAVDEKTLPPTLRATHRSLFDGTLQGMERTDCEAFSFQGHPEASPGPHDVRPLFERFVRAMAARRAPGQIAATA